MPRRTAPLLKLVDLVFLVRPPLLAASATFFFLGAISSHRFATGSYRASLMLRSLPDLALFLLVVAFAFVVNQIFDVESDRINRKNFLLPSKLVTRTESLVCLALLAVGAALLCAQRGGYMALLALAGLLLGAAYSVPPVRLKARPVGDLLANVAGFGWIGFMMGWLVFGDLGRDALTRSLPYAVAMASIFLNTCIPDEEGDRLAGDRTTCVVFGRRAVALAALVLMVLAVAGAAVLGEAVCAIAALGALPGFIAVAADPTSANSVLASQLAARVLFVVASVTAPLLAAIGVGAYVFSRIYYARRFGITYPRLAGAKLEPERPPSAGEFNATYAARGGQDERM